MERVQPAVADAYGDRIVSQPAGEQLAEAQHSVLAGGELRDRDIASGRLFRLSLKK